jgi:ribosome-associated translation inhibitor RaiA
MSLNIHYSGCFRLAQRESAITKVIEGFRAALRIDEARVRVERSDQGPYPFRVEALLVTPGPDIKAEGSDYTFEAALRKMSQGVVKALRWRRDKKRRSAPVRKRERRSA